jgi:hypothetical protein
MNNNNVFIKSKLYYGHSYNLNNINLTSSQPSPKGEGESGKELIGVPLY